MEDLIAEQDDLIDDVDLRLDRHAGGEDGEEEVRSGGGGCKERSDDAL